MTNTAAPALFAAQKLTGTGAVHVVKAGSSPSAWSTIWCTGRSVLWMVGTDKPVTCKACQRKATVNGMDLRDLR